MMRGCVLWSTGVALAIVGVGAPASAQESADAIVHAAIDNNSTGFQSGVGRMTVLTEDKGGDRKERVILFKGASGPAGRRTLVRLLAPDEVKGQAFLFREVKDAEDQVYWYLPAFGVTRRISGGQKKGSFMGTHFTFADLESRDIKEATYKKLPDDKIATAEVYVIEARPKHADDSDYGKVVLFIRKTDRMLLKARFFDKAGAELKTMFIEKLDKSGEHRYVKQMTLRPADGGLTRMTIDAVDFDAPLSDVEFTPEALSNE